MPNPLARIFDPPKPKKSVVSVSVDADILARFKAKCKGSFSSSIEELMKLALEDLDRNTSK